MDDFSGLIKYLENLNAGVCTQNSFVENNKTLVAKLNDLDSPIYLEFGKSKDLNQKIIINDTLLNSTIKESEIVLCVSYNDPYPNENSSELCHYGKNHGIKELVMYNKSNALKNFKNFDDVDYDFNYEKFDYKKIRILENLNDNEKEVLYVSIKGKNVNFTVKGEECDPNACVFGTNDDVSTGIYTGLLIIIIFLAILIGFIILYFLKYRGKKNNTIEDFNINNSYGKIIA